MRVWFAIILITAAFTAAAQTMYRWVDKDGHVHYSDKPPAASEGAKVEQKRAVTLGVPTPEPSALMRQAMTDYPVTVFTQATCGDPCQMGRDFLNKRGVPFTEKNIETEKDAAALRALTGGGEKLTIPVIQVGSKSLTGFSSSQWESLLDAAGYPKAAAKAAAKPQQ
jgi:glutaredoxin